MKNTFDYPKMYKNHYKNLPTAYFIGTLFCGVIASIILFFVFLDAGGFGAASLCFLGGIVGTVVLAYVNRFAVAVAISQKIVVADTLLAMKNNSPAPVDEDELPEL